MTMIHAWLRLLLLLSNDLFSSCQAATTRSGFPISFMTVDAEKAAARRYDYIVNVGGGAAGCPLATTLSTNYSVLVVERGGSPYGVPDIENADALGKLLIETDNYTSPAQTFISEEGVSLARGRVLGGGTALNAGFYSRASSEYVRNVRRDERLVEESYEWVENQNAFEPHLSSFSLAIRHGLVEAGVLPDNGYTLDHVEGTKISASTFDNNGKRHTAADLLKSANPHNIVVLLNATVSRILFNSPPEETKDGSFRTPRARGVEFMDGLGRSYNVSLIESSRSSEVILTAGALSSPQLLLLSGIGPSQQLKQFHIPLVVDLPSVGQRIQDNPRASVSYQSRQFYNLQVVGILKGSQNYIEYSSLVNGSASVYDGIITEKLAFPLSRGDLRLRSRDPRDNPSVRYNYYSDPQDLKRCVEGVRVIAKLLDTPSLQEFDYCHDFEFTGQPLPENVSDDAAMAQFCRDTLATICNYHGGCEVGYVVNKRYEVIGVDRLRIVDGSTFTDSPGTNPQATVMMLGRYVGMKLILQEWGETRMNEGSIFIGTGRRECPEFSLFDQYHIT